MTRAAVHVAGDKFLIKCFKVGTSHRLEATPVAHEVPTGLVDRMQPSLVIGPSFS